jgi:hypothetical protein
MKLLPRAAQYMGVFALVLSLWSLLSESLPMEYCSTLNTASTAASEFPRSSGSAENSLLTTYVSRLEHIPIQRPLLRFLRQKEPGICHCSIPVLLVHRLHPRLVHDGSD